jgi:tripartite-type tricarboxylate transporter receptor subunit TctC
MARLLRRATHSIIQELLKNPMILSRRSALMGVTSLPLIARSRSSSAANWTPARPLRVVIPFTAGGTTDVLVRQVQETLSKELGQSVLVDNRPGASTIIGTQEVAHAPADGLTMLLVANSFAANISLRPNLPYDSLKDFVPIVRAAAVTNVLLTHSDLADNFQDFIAAARRSTGGLSYGSYGIGTTNHLAGEQLCQLAQFNATHVPYNGASQPILDLSAKRIDFLLVNAPDALARRTDARIRMLAVSSEDRMPQLSDVPTFREAGYPAIVADSWFGILARSDVPLVARERLETVWKSALGLPDTRTSLEDRGFSGLGMSSSFCAEQIRHYAQVYAEIIRHGNIRVE